MQPRNGDARRRPDSLTPSPAPSDHLGPATGRDRAIDVARGIAIVAVVTGHVLRGLAAAGLVDVSSAAYTDADHSLYAFHLATFVLLAGLFVGRGFERGRWAYLGQRVWLFAYLYVLWSVIQGLTKVATAAVVNTPVSLSDVVALWRPQGQFWFLPFFALLTVAVCVVRPWAGPTRAALGVAGGLAISAVAWGHESPVLFASGWGLTVFGVIGAAITAPVLARRMAGAPTLALAPLAAALWAAMLVLVVALDAPPPTIPRAAMTPGALLLGLTASACGVAAVLVTARAISAAGSLAAPFDGLARLLAWLGRHSLEIFLAHIVFASGVRIVLSRAGVDDLAVQLVCGVLAGLVGPALLVWLSRRLGVSLLFEPPRRRI